MSRLVPPKLNCPECGVPLIEATVRGYLNSRTGEWIEHRAGCRCAYCDWAWMDDADPVTCACGSLVEVAVDDGHAYAQLSPVEKPETRTLQSPRVDGEP